MASKAQDTGYMLNYYDRKGEASAKKKYANAGTYSCSGENKTGQRIPKIGAQAEAGVGRASAAISVLEAEARGPNASAGAEVSLLGASAVARAEVAGVEGRAGPLKGKLALGVDTGASVGLDGVEAKVLGCGFSVGRKVSVSLCGSEVGFSLW